MIEHTHSDEEYENKFFDHEYNLSKLFLEHKKWYALPIADLPNLMEIELLCNAMKIYQTIPFAFSTNQNHEITKNKIGKTIEDIQSKNFDHSHEALVITDSENYCYFKPDHNEFFIIAGELKFIKTAYPASAPTAKSMFFEWAQSSHFNKKEYDFFNNIWRKYEDLNPPT